MSATDATAKKVVLIDEPQVMAGRVGRLMAAAAAAVATPVVVTPAEGRSTPNWGRLTGGWGKYGAMPAYGGSKAQARRQRQIVAGRLRAANGVVVA